MDGTAYLTGTVDSWFEKTHAGEVASGIRGHFRIPPASSTPAPDSVIERHIQRQLLWSPFVNAADVDVKIEAGMATLDGTVDSRLEKTAARDNPYEGGAFFVHDHLVVDSG